MSAPSRATPVGGPGPDGTRDAAPNFRPRRVKVPVVLQMDAAESAAACLGMVLGYHGRTVPLTELTDACQVSRAGASVDLVVRAAEAYGLRTTVHRRRLSELANEDVLPQILAWRSGHWVVLEGYGRGTLIVTDPETGPTTVSLSEAERLYGGTTLLAEPGPGFTTGTGTMSLRADLTTRLRPGRLGILLGIFAGLFLIVPGLVLPLVVTQLATQVLQPDGGSDPLPLVEVFLASSTLVGLLTLLQDWFVVRVQARLTTAGSFRLVDHLLHLPVRYFSQRLDGLAVTRLDQVYYVIWLLTGPLIGAGVAAVGLLAYGAVMVVYSPGLAAVVIAALFINVGVLVVIARRRRGGNVIQIRQAARLAGFSMSVVSDIEAIKAAGGDDAAFERWAGYQAGYLQAAQKVGRVVNGFTVLPVFLTSLTSVTLIVLGATSVISGTLSLSVLVGFQALATAFLAPVSQVTGLLRQSQLARARLAEVNDMLDSPTDPAFTRSSTGTTGAMTTTRNSPAASPPGLRGELEVRGVEFGYVRTEPPVVAGVDLTLRPGSRVALVGGSGSGKSTVIKLILGLHEPWGGQILFDGRPRAEWDRSNLTRAVAYVDQRILLFQGTVRDNLTLWDDAVPAEQLIRAARDACIHDEIVGRPGGYEAVVQEGGRNFSGGQRQRLEIARALVLDPAILVLDEATSALDTETEQRIDRNLRRRGATCLIVAHRLSTVRDCDEIVVLEGGRVVQRGTHDELVGRGGRYADLVTAE